MAPDMIQEPLGGGGEMVAGGCSPITNSGGKVEVG